MRLDGDLMIIRPKDAIKLIGVSIIACCAIFVCTLFFNYNLDMARIDHLITDEMTRTLYDLQALNGKVVCAVSGGCLLITSVIMLCFYLKHYIDTHRKELGILKALGYPNLKIAKSFSVFGLSVFTGTALGFCSALALMPKFYEVMGEDNTLIKVTLNFNPIIILHFVVLPTILFGLFAVCYSYFKLKRPTMELLKGKGDISAKKKRLTGKKETELPFLGELKKNTVKSRRTLVFFIAFSAFCYSAMAQMSMAMKDYSSAMMAIMTIGIGFVLAFTTLILAITTVINSNAKQISIMQVFGYSFRECSNSILNGYRPIAYIGFAIGTGYQYGLMKIMVSIFASGLENIPEYSFNFKVFTFVLITFALLYELAMYCYSARIKKISVKSVMLDQHD